MKTNQVIEITLDGKQRVVTARSVVYKRIISLVVLLVFIILFLSYTNMTYVERTADDMSKLKTENQELETTIREQFEQLTTLTSELESLQKEMNSLEAEVKKMKEGK